LCPIYAEHLHFVLDINGYWPEDDVGNFGKFEDFIANLKLSNLAATTTPCLIES
jgi:hypothetical protein